MRPLKTIFESRSVSQSAARTNILTPEMRRLYGGDLSFPRRERTDRPYIVGSCVTTIDGIAAYPDYPESNPWNAISDSKIEDSFFLGLLRTVSDAILVGVNTLRIESNHLWTPAYAAPRFRDLFEKQRRTLGKTDHFFNLFLFGSGSFPLTAAVLRQRNITTVIFTKMHIGKRIARAAAFRNAQIEVVSQENFLPAILRRIRTRYGVRLLLLEGGPTTFGSFLTHHALDELFLTEAPKIAGNNRHAMRPTFAQGTAFPPREARRVSILSEKIAGDYRFLRYKIL